MVAFFKALLPPLLLATYVAAQDSTTTFDIINPNSTVWWVANSVNVMRWDCDSPQAKNVNNFTVLFQTPTTPPLAIVAIQNNDQCSITISKEKVNAPAANGYFLLLADPRNNTNVYAKSQPFEIKALGSAYPSTSAPGPSGATGTGEASSTASSNSSSNAASLSSHSSSFLGLTGIMGLLTVGLLGA